MSAAAQLRKIKKPLIEKKRRERMNECLNQLKALVLEGKNTQENESRYSKMEKVDILEMTVRYLKSLRIKGAPVSGSPMPFNSKYVEGYNECAVQVGNYLANTTEFGEDTRQQLGQHLARSVANSPSAIRYPFGSDVRFTEPGAAPMPLPVPTGPPPPVVSSIVGDLDKESIGRSEGFSPPMFGDFHDITSGFDGGFVCTTSFLSNTTPVYHLRSSAMTSENSMCRVLPASVIIASGLQRQPLLSPTQRGMGGEHTSSTSLSSPTLLVATEASYGPLNTPNDHQLCGSPRQGDEYPSSLFTSDGGPREPTDIIFTPKMGTPISFTTFAQLPTRPTHALIPSLADNTGPHSFLGLGQRGLQIPLGPVWRPWKGKTH